MIHRDIDDRFIVRTGAPIPTPLINIHKDIRSLP
jgi:hypothetical protein